ncbi:MAG: hypothetical protein KJ787_00845 [Gammaproteobacteria bacterium]|nr:hypothetical protein [Gammaproteobacteria bacterium]MBU1644863.1 hypothetical protein [Gammaproteobacteria bacterium]MBU1973096.1 hypothetical protein [Gammaproteobacteria bacterium]
MFRKLFSLKPGARSNHPLGSDDNVTEMLAAIPPDPARTLQDLDNWLADSPRFQDEIGSRALLRAVLQMDATAEMARAVLLERYLLPSHREHLSEVLWTALDQNLRHVVQGYRHCIQLQLRQPQDGVDRHDLLLALLRAIAAAAARKKLLHFRYRPAEAAWWKEMHGLISAAGQLGLANEAARPFDDCEKKYTALQLYLAAAYFELAPLSNLVPQQVEAIDRLLVNGADTLELAGSRTSASTHRIDLGGDHGPVPLGDDAAADPGTRYLSRGRLRSLVTRLATDLRKSREVPESLHTSGVDIGQVRQLVTVLMQHWAEPPPTRGTARQSTDDELRVVLGFGLARRMVAFSDFARSGRSLEYNGGNIDALFQESRFGSLAADEVSGDAPAPAVPAEPLVANPLNVLEKLELSGDRQMMEHWVQADISDTGLGAVAPGVRAKHRIGGLVCLRYAEGIEWHLGLIRRIGRNGAGQATLGIETLPRPSASAQVKPLEAGNSAAWAKLEDAGHGYLDAILVAVDGDELILPRGAFAADLAVRVRTGETARQVKLTELVERGDDFDRVRFAAID